MIFARGTSPTVPRPTACAVAQHGEAVRDRLDLFEEVADVDDRDAARLQPLHQVEQPLRVFLRRGAGRLVEHEHLSRR